MLGKEAKLVTLSTGQANIEEINSVIRIFENNKVALMHCVSSYPTPDEQANLRSITFLRLQYNLPVGYSDRIDEVAGKRLIRNMKRNEAITTEEDIC